MLIITLFQKELHFNKKVKHSSLPSAENAGAVLAKLKMRI
jgi:hypothetical protein